MRIILMRKRKRPLYGKSVKRVSNEWGKAGAVKKGGASPRYLNGAKGLAYEF